MELRVSVRRGNALAKLNRISEAVQEYERALKMDPSNESIKKDLDVLRKTKWKAIILTGIKICNAISYNDIIFSFNFLILLISLILLN